MNDIRTRFSRQWIFFRSMTLFAVLLGSPAFGQTLPDVPGYTVEVYAEAENFRPVCLCFGANGEMYAGWNGGAATPGQIRRVAPGGGAGSVTPYGPTVSDPDPIAYDATGAISGTAGAVITGGMSPTHLTAITPDSAQVLWTSGFSNPTDIAFDSAGRMLFVDATAAAVFEITDSGPVRLFNTPTTDADVIVIGEGDTIYISHGDTNGHGWIRAYDRQGGPLGDPLVSTATTHNCIPFAFGSGEPWGSALYYIANRQLFRVDVPGDPVVVGTGFTANFLGDMLFGPDGALYVSSCWENRVLRIAPGNTPPAADAGPDLAINSADQSLTTIEGKASDPDGDALQYRWLVEDIVHQNWQDVVDGRAPLDLNSLPTLALGDHSLTLEVNDGTATSTDTMTLTILNTPPVGVLNPASLTVEIGSAFTIQATAADFDGDVLAYQWVKDSEVLGSGNIDAPDDGSPISVPDLVIAANDSRFGLGVHSVDFVLADSANEPVATPATVTVEDSTSPTLSPVSSESILWPPNHELRLVTIQANASDAGGAVTLTARVESNEPQEDGGDGSTDQDWTTPVIDDLAGIVDVNLRAERSGSGEGRVYTITITATDQSNNISVATVEVRVPHDRRNK